MKYNAPRFGISVPTYRRVKWPDFPEYQAVGRWEAEYFDPLEWRNDYPNPAFVRMTARDAFWAAKILAKFTAEELLAIERTGQYSDPENERYFHQVLLERQEKCVRFGINGLNPLADFRVENDALEFTNLSEKYGFVEGNSTKYRVLWHVFDNRQMKRVNPLGEATEGVGCVSPLPEPKRLLQDQNLLLLAEISSLHEKHPHWVEPIQVYLRSNGTSYEVVGIERNQPGEYIGMK
jgi:hypothetical protein